jgi:transcriptional repressor NrdR
VLRCPSCQHPESKVLETRASSDGVRRRRQCLDCGVRFTTMERIELKLPLIVKKDGSREPFDRDKVIKGLRVACRKRPVSAEDLEDAANRIEQRLVASSQPEVASERIGRALLEELKSVDPVAYLRFASVYLEVDSVEELLRLVEPWVGPDALPWREPSDADPDDLHAADLYLDPDA